MGGLFTTPAPVQDIADAVYEPPTIDPPILTDAPPDNSVASVYRQLEACSETHDQPELSVNKTTRPGKLYLCSKEENQILHKKPHGPSVVHPRKKEVLAPQALVYKNNKRVRHLALNRDRMNSRKFIGPEFDESGYKDIDYKPF